MAHEDEITRMLDEITRLKAPIGELEAHVGLTGTLATCLTSVPAQLDRMEVCRREVVKLGRGTTTNLWRSVDCRE
jgi:hypothetical protein